MSGAIKSVGKAVGGLLGGGSDDAAKAASRAAASQAEAAQQAAIASAFRPVGLTTRFGTSGFDYTNVGGIPRVSSATYQISPELQAIQDALMGLTGGAIDYSRQAQGAASPLGGAAQSLFGLGQQYLATSPEQARQQYMQEQYAMLDPIRQREEQRLASSVFGRGRAGLNVGDMGQPELFALASARRAQDAQLAAQADQAAQQRIGFGSGLFGSGAGLLGQQYGIPTQALGPLQSYLGTIGSIEELGQQPFQLGLQVGGAAQPGATAGASLLQSGLSNAAQSQLAGQLAGQQQQAGLSSGLLGSLGNIGMINQLRTGSMFGAGGLSGLTSSIGSGLSGLGTSLMGGLGSIASMFSDIRTKQNLERVGRLSNGLNLYSFEYKPEFQDMEGAGKGRFVGVLADEVENVMPEAVSVNKDGYKMVDYSLIKEQ